MKTSKIFLLVIFAILTFSSFQAKSQAEVIFDKTITFRDGDGGTFESVDSKVTLSASGNIIKTATFQLPQDHFLIPEAGINYIYGVVKQKNIYSELVFMYDFRIQINKTGNFKITTHYNGAGVITPAVFKDYFD